MGFEDDFDYNDDFEIDIADPDNMGGGEQPKKLSRKELREAKKKNAEKTADLPKHKKSLFGKRERLDDNDETLTDEHIFDPTRSTMISTPRDRSSRENENAPLRNAESEFSYLFDPVDDNESEDDVYPEKSIYSDGDAARDLLAGLSYDGSKGNDSEDFDRYFDEHSKPVKSKFSFKKKKDEEEERQPEPEALPVEPEPPKPAPVKVVPKKTAPSEEDSYLPELRPDSVFSKPSKPEPEPTAEYRNDPPLPPLPKRSDDRRYYDDPYDNYDDRDEDDYYMNHDQDKPNQDYMPYGGMYPSYPMAPMAPMNQMMPYPVVIPNSGQNQSGNMPIQTIPIPYPMPMPMPMPMYGQYPAYPPQYQQYPPYPPQEPYGRYRDERRDDRRDDSYDRRRDSERGRRRFNEHRRDDDRRYYDDRADDRYDDRYYDRYEDRYDDRRERRYDDRRDGYYYNRDNREEPPRTYPQPPYEPPYRSQQEFSQPVQQPQPVQQAAPEPIAPIFTPPPAPEPEQPKFTPSPLTNFDFNFHKHTKEEKPEDTQPKNDQSSLSGFESNLNDNASGTDGFDSDLNDDAFGNDGFDSDLSDNAFGNDGFDSDLSDNVFGNDGFDDGAFDNADFGDISFGGDSASKNDDDDEFGFGFGGRSISSDRQSSPSDEGGKSSGGRFKKRK